MAGGDVMGRLAAPARRERRRARPEPRARHAVAGLAAAASALALAGGGCSCGGASGGSAGATAPEPAPAHAARDAAAAPPPDAARQRAAGAAERYESLLIDAEVVAALDDDGFSFADLVPGGPATGGSLAELARDTEFARVADALAADLAAMDAADPRAGVGMGHAHRLFDPAWLRSPDTRFELVAVVSRLDRRPLVDGACGEVRLVYRLAYTARSGGRSVSSRLPMTIALDWLEVPPRDGRCREAALRWRAPLAAGPDARRPVGPERLRPERFHRLQVNVQSVRWPSAVHPSLGGHAEYILRSFTPGPDGGLAPEPLENTPDVAALRRNAAARAELLAWIRDPDTLRRIDEGTARMPARFAAERAVSAAPRGLARLGNRPFARLLSEGELEGLDLSRLERVRSPAGLLRRLDDLTCTGCHQGRALAGFHLLGEDGADTAGGNAVASPLSPHARAEARRRTRLLAAEARGDEAPSYARPFSERDGDRPGAYGAPCGLTDDPTFAAWDCDDPLRCRPYGAPRIGICLPEEPEVGDPCEVGALRARDDPKDDRAVSPEARSCGAGAACNRNRVGFPGGMCTASCETPGEAGRCGVIAVLEPFNACVARGEPFDACLRDHVRPAGLRACGEESPCRHDYLCARNADGEGVCIPPYFLFQMRVDGHP